MRGFHSPKLSLSHAPHWLKAQRPASFNTLALVKLGVPLTRRRILSNSYAVVITTINHPTRAVVEISRDGPRLGADVVIVGDDKSPPDFDQKGARYFDVAAQRGMPFKYAAIAPTQHYARKNIGYLAAIAAGALVIIETDDDNIPQEDFWTPRNPWATAAVVEHAGWVNVYAYFAKAGVWPRGFPLPQVQKPVPHLSGATRNVFCPIQQGLADGDPDVDAIYRLVAPLPITFAKRAPVALIGGSWCPFNSQNTTWWQVAFPLLYLPFYCSFRMTDIWRSFVALRIAAENEWGVLFHNATVFQERNEHDLMRDFEQEIPGYLHNDEIKARFQALSLSPGIENIPGSMRRCYSELIHMGLVQEPELALLEAWLQDIEHLSRPV